MKNEVKIYILEWKEFNNSLPITILYHVTALNIWIEESDLGLDCLLGKKSITGSFRTDQWLLSFIGRL